MEDVFMKRIELAMQRTFEKIMRNEAVMMDCKSKTRHHDGIDAGEMEVAAAPFTPKHDVQLDSTYVNTQNISCHRYK